MSAWLKRFGLHLAAAVGATGIFVAAAAVGASQTRQHVAIVSASPTAARTRTPVAQRTPTVVVATPTPVAEVQPPPGVPQPGVATSPSPPPTARPANSPTPASPRVVPERSLAGTIKAVRDDGLDVMGVGGREWHVAAVPGALIRLNGKTARLDSLQPGDTVVILGQAQPGPGNPFMAHAITARRK